MRIILAVGILFSLSGCIFNRIVRTNDITYQSATSGLTGQKLDIYAPRKSTSPKPVIIFIHGGNWNSGQKSTYQFLGKRFAHKGVVTVIIDYPLSPAATYDEMAKASAQSVNWVRQNISSYGGDTSRVFVSGHSAGGHLAALIAMDPRYFDALLLTKPIAGAVLIDAAGLDMYQYLLEMKYPATNTYIKTFTNDPATWKQASPRYYLNTETPPLLIYQGRKTYPSIEKGTKVFMKDLRAIRPDAHFKIQKGKKHIPMITQCFFPWNPLYHEIISFMESSGAELPSK